VQPIEILGRITREPWISTRLHPDDFKAIMIIKRQQVSQRHWLRSGYCHK
jgi:hypothetical protein